MENTNSNQPQQPPVPPTNAKSQYAHKGVLAVIILAIIAGLCVWEYFNFYQPQSVMPVVVSHKPSTTSVATSTQTSEASSTPTISPYYIQPSTPLPSQLTQLPDLHLFKYRYSDGESATTSFINYYQVQNITVNGAKLILAQDGYCDGEGCEPVYYRFLQNGNNFTFLTKYSPPLDGSYDISQSDLNTSTISNMDVPVLDVPSKLQDPKTNAIVEFNSNSFLIGDFFNPQGKTLIFTANGYSVFSTDGPNYETFVAQAPDGKELFYSLNDPFLQEDQNGNLTGLNIQWNNGISHPNDYQFDPLDSCAESDIYVSAATSTVITQSELTIVGTDKNSGQPIYAINNPNNPILLAVQAQNQTLNQENSQASQAGGVSFQPTPYSPYDVIYWTDPFGRLVRFVDFPMEDCGGKPVIYLYPTKATEVSVKVSPAGGISKSEPDYTNGWNVLAQPDGTLSANGQQYPYLFWEGGLGSYQTPNKGFVVDEPDVKQLLNDKLSTIGLNAKEISDFEQFWLPRMKSAPYYFVTFTINTAMEAYAPLTISPKPDTVIRVLMDYKPLQNYETVPPLELQPTQRQGFAVVEWGGVLK